MTTTIRMVGSLVIVGLFALLALAGLAQGRAPQDREVRFIIPAGNARREASGQTALMLPKLITLSVGGRDTLVIRNEDAFVTRIAGVALAPGQQYTQRFVRAGTYEMVCATLFHDDRFTVVIVDRRTGLERLVSEALKRLND
jgi:hypothetical protein